MVCQAIELRVLAVHEAKSTNTWPFKSLKEPFEQWAIDQKREGKVEKHPVVGNLKLRM